MATSRKMRQAVAYERLYWRLDLPTAQRERFRLRAARLRREDARDKARAQLIKENQRL